MKKGKVLIARGWIDMTEMLVEKELDVMTQRNEILSEDRTKHFEPVRLRLKSEIDNINARYSIAWKSKSRKLLQLLERGGINAEIVDYLTKPKLEESLYSSDYFGIYLYMHGYLRSDNIIKAGIILAKYDLGNESKVVAEKGVDFRALAA